MWAIACWEICSPMNEKLDKSACCKMGLHAGSTRMFYQCYWPDFLDQFWHREESFCWCYNNIYCLTCCKMGLHACSTRMFYQCYWPDFLDQFWHEEESFCWCYNNIYSLTCCKYDMFDHMNMMRCRYRKGPNILLGHIDDDLSISLIYLLWVKYNVIINKSKTNFIHMLTKFDRRKPKLNWVN
jgi:hypothetical protein